jgi:hypothetical protein
MTMHRRSFLLGLGTSLAATAISRRLFSDTPTPAPKRLVLVMQNNGTQQANFWPTQGFTSPILEPILGDPKLRGRTSVVRGVFAPHDTNGTNGNEHDVGFARMFTGQPLMSAGGQPWGGGPSVDQIVARAWNLNSLTLAVLTSSVQPHPKPGFDHRRSFSYIDAGVHKLPTLDPIDAYTRLFTDPGASGDDARRRLLMRQSALDAVAGNLSEVQARLGRHQREMLDVHLTSVRRLEESIGRTLAGKASPGATCGWKPAAPRHYRQTAPQLLVDDESAIPELIGVMTDLIASALGCGATRVATLQLGFGGGKWKFAWEGINVDVHDELAHKDTTDAGVDPTVTERLVRVNHYYASQVAALAQKLDAIPEGGGTVLDNTLIVWANELGRGDHSLQNMPVVFIGGKGSGVVPAGFVDAGPQTFQRVGCTILRAMGLHADGFGDEPACGSLAGLSVVGPNMPWLARAP